MADLSAEQLELKQSITRGATIFGAVVGIIVAVIVWFVLGSQDIPIRAASALVLGGAAGFGIYRWNFGSRSKSAQCAKCGAAFSISRTDHQETLTGSEDKVEREPQEDGSTKVTRFTEEKYDVVDTYTCSKCADVTTREYKTTRRTNEETKVDPAVPEGPADMQGEGKGGARAGIASTPVSSAKGANDPGDGDVPPPSAPGGLGRA